LKCQSSRKMQFVTHLRTIIVKSIFVYFSCINKFLTGRNLLDLFALKLHTHFGFNCVLSHFENSYTGHFDTRPLLYIFECSKFYRKHTHYFFQQNEANNHNTHRNTDAIVTTQEKSPHNNADNTYNKLPRELKLIKSYFLLKKTV
jgi:hypothetical protein